MGLNVGVVIRGRSVTAAVVIKTSRWLIRGLRMGLVILGTVLVSVLHDSGVDADELIRRAAQAERTTSVTASAVALTFVPQRGGTPIRIIHSSLMQGTMPDAVPIAFQPALRSIDFDWQRPLTIDAVARFRLTHRQEDRADQVTRRDQGTLFVLTTALTTSIAAGPLRELQVSVDAESYKVIREHLTFPGIGALDIEDLSRSTAYVPRRLAMPAIRPSRDELDRAELRVRLLLADTGADLEQHLQISQTPENVRVRADADGARWDTRLGTQLRALAHVHVDLSTAAGTGTHVVPGDTLPTSLGLERWRKRRFGTPAARASILPTLIDSLDTVRRRLTVLADLAKRYPSPRRELSSEARALFGQLVDQQHRRLRAELSDAKNGIFGLWGPVRLRQEPRSAPATLVSSATVALSRARALDTIVRTAVAQDDLTPDEEQHLRDAFESLWESVYGQAPAREPGWCVQDVQGGRATCGVPRQ